MYDITYNGIAAVEYGVRVIERPDIPAAKKQITEIEIPGRDGVLIETDGTYDDIEIKVSLNYMTEKELWAQVYRDIKRWLLSDGKRELQFSDDLDYFYKVKHVEVGESSRISKCIGVITPTFLCEPFSYLISGKYEHDLEEVLYNPYHTAHPIYKIAGEGVCTLTVNGKEITANVGQNLTVNTELMLAYREDGTIMNTSVSGDYQDLYLQSGENEVSISAGVELKVIPNWRCL